MQMQGFNNDIVRGLRRRKPGLHRVRVQEAGLSGAVIVTPAFLGIAFFSSSLLLFAALT